MPRYYFDAKRAQMTILDQQASELPNSPFAEMEAAATRRRNCGAGGRKHSRRQQDDHHRDDSWVPLFKLPF
jgi:hypothetical protein